MSMISRLPYTSTYSILSLCCLRMWRIWCALRLQRCGQKGHWNVGCLPHSYFRWRRRESLRIYDLPQRSQGNTPWASAVVVFCVSFESAFGSNLSSVKSAAGSKPVTTSPRVMDQPVHGFVASLLLCSGTGNIKRYSGSATNGLNFGQIMVQM